MQEISETTGESMRKLYDRISDGAISVDEITASIERSTSEGGKYFQSMEKQSATLNGRMSTLKDTINNKLGASFQWLSDLLRDKLIPFAIDFLENLDRYAPIILTVVGVFGTLISLFYIYNLQQLLAVKGMTLWNAVCGIGASVTTALGSAFAFLTSPMVIIVGVIALVVLAIKKLWDTNEQFRNAVMRAWENIRTSLFNIYTTVLKPIFEELTKILNTCWEEGVKPLWDGFVEFVGGIITIILDMWNIVKPIFDLLVEYFGVKIADKIKFLATVFGEVFIVISDLIQALFRRFQEFLTGFKNVLGGVVDLITGVFTGNWKKAWEGVKKIFFGIFDSFGAIIKTPINLVISGLNTLINGLNKISFDIPSWVPVIGGKKFGISIPKIPQLERGGILRKGQTGYLEGNGSEAVVPLDRNKYWIKSVARDMLQAQANQGVTNNNNDTINVVFNDTQTSPDAITRKIYQMKTYGLARGV